MFVFTSESGDFILFVSMCGGGPKFAALTDANRNEAFDALAHRVAQTHW